MLRFALALATGLAACAPPAPVATPADHPAVPGAPAAPSVVALAPLPPPPPPDLPAALRPDGRPPGGAGAGMTGMDHGQMAHGQMDHGATSAAESQKAEALDAYLALHDALASDRLDAAAARRFADAFDALADTPPSGDPHFWHSLPEPVAAVRAAAADLAETSDLAAARTAFGHLSAPFARLLAAVGVPEGYAVARFTCGMAPGVPEGGVWVQRAGETRNPYFGSAMLTCGSSDGALTPPGQAVKEGHSATDHSGH